MCFVQSLRHEGCAAPPSTPTQVGRADYSLVRASAVQGTPENTDPDSLLKDTGIAVRACESLEDADLFRTLLGESKVPALVITSKRGYAVRFPEIVVFPEDVDRA